jgi:predicted TIM-barrel fold metal-dependent hydrolase
MARLNIRNAEIHKAVDVIRAKGQLMRQGNPSKPIILQNVKVIDADTHVSEPHDLWTRRATENLKKRVPQVRTLDGKLTWVIDGDKPFGEVHPASAIRRDGYKSVGAEFRKWTFEDVHPASYDVKARLAQMDSAGIAAQIAYPNILGFGGQQLSLVDRDLRLSVTQIYNDAMAEMQAESGQRIFPMMLLPWWNINEAVAEVERCRKMGMRGVNTNSDPQDCGLPDLGNPYWYPLWEACCEADMPVNFHIGASESTVKWIGPGVWNSLTESGQLAVWSTMLFISNARVLTNILVSRLLERFPKLNIVSVESGVGWIPFMLQAVEYQMKEAGIGFELTPSEVFKRQIYACSWFEKPGLVSTARKIGIDHVLFETDFPHPTCLYPDALHYVADIATEMTELERQKVFSSNAANLYRIALT